MMFPTSITKINYFQLKIISKLYILKTNLIRSRSVSWLRIFFLLLFLITSTIFFIQNINFIITFTWGEKVVRKRKTSCKAEFFRLSMLVSLWSFFFVGFILFSSPWCCWFGCSLRCCCCSWFFDCFLLGWWWWCLFGKISSLGSWLNSIFLLESLNSIIKFFTLGKLTIFNNIFLNKYYLRGKA